MYETVKAYKDMFGDHMHVNLLTDMVNVLTALSRFKSEYDNNAGEFPEGGILSDLYFVGGDINENIYSLLELMKFVSAILEKAK